MNKFGRSSSSSNNNNSSRVGGKVPRDVGVSSTTSGILCFSHLFHSVDLTVRNVQADVSS